MKKIVAVILTITFLFIGTSVVMGNDNNAGKQSTDKKETENIVSLVDDNIVYASDAENQGIMKSNTTKRVMVGLAAVTAALLAAVAGGGGGGGGGH
jgi:preprotein translocase subunit SecG